MRLQARTCVRPDGHAMDWEYVSRTGTGAACCVIAVTTDPPRELILVRQFRPPLDGHVIEAAGDCIDAKLPAFSEGLRRRRWLDQPSASA